MEKINNQDIFLLSLRSLSKLFHKLTALRATISVYLVALSIGSHLKETPLCVPVIQHIGLLPLSIALV